MPFIMLATVAWTNLACSEKRAPGPNIIFILADDHRWDALDFITQAPADRHFCLSLSFSAPHAHDPAEEQYFWQPEVDHLYQDNGYFEGERQLAGKWLMYDNSLRVLLIIYDPHAKSHGDIEDMALNIDVTSTIMDFAGLPVPANDLQHEESYNLKADPLEINNLAAGNDYQAKLTEMRNRFDEMAKSLESQRY